MKVKLSVLLAVMLMATLVLGCAKTPPPPSPAPSPVAPTPTPSPTPTPTDPPFYEGKTLTMLITSRPGGGTDTVGRLIAQFLPRHIPGNPRVIVRNNPQSTAGTNVLYETKPNGLTLGWTSSGPPIDQALKNPAVKYDLRKFEMLGNIERGMSVIMLREEALARLTDPSAEPVYHGTTAKPNQDIILVLGQD